VSQFVAFELGRAFVRIKIDKSKASPRSGAAILPPQDIKDILKTLEASPWLWPEM
jgi:hypothetical protein